LESKSSNNKIGEQNKSLGLLLRLHIDDIPMEDGGELCLLSAILRSAVHDWLIYRNSKTAKYREISEEARRWIFRDKEESVGSFTTYCLSLGTEPELVRERVRKFAALLSYRPRHGIQRRNTVHSREHSTAAA
jgi:hypothetical protein